MGFELNEKVINRFKAVALASVPAGFVILVWVQLGSFRREEARDLEARQLRKIEYLDRKIERQQELLDKLLIQVGIIESRIDGGK